MALNIKNEETHRLIAELAHLTGESQTTAVTRAVAERLDRHRQAQRPSMATRLVALGAEMASRMPDDALAVDHGALLYDEQGLPR
jgi:antitoxin VapB